MDEEQNEVGRSYTRQHHTLIADESVRTVAQLDEILDTQRRAHSPESAEEKERTVSSAVTWVTRWKSR